MRMVLFGLAWISSISFSNVGAQDTLVDLRTFKPSRPEFIAMFQMWATYSPELDKYITDSPFPPTYIPEYSIWNLQVRRARIGIKGNILPRLNYTAILAFDQVGHNPGSGTVGGTNNGSFPSVGLLDAYITWGIRRNGEGMRISAGYFRPQYGRESITSGFAVNSIEKTMDQNYLREHLVFSNPGRAAGINAGCQLRLGSNQAWLRWDAGVFMPDGQSVIRHPVVGVARIVGTWGDPESPAYSLSHKINSYGKRNGLSVGIGGSRGQGEGFVTRNWAYGIDLLLNRGPFQLDGELHWLGKNLEPITGDPEFFGDQYVIQTGHLRGGVNISIDHFGYLEPTLTYAFLFGGMNENDQKVAEYAAGPAGKESYLEAGVNWWFNPKTVVQLHYTFRQGDPGFAGDGAEVNSYFTQSGIGAIRRGDWVGLALRWML